MTLNDAIERANNTEPTILKDAIIELCNRMGVFDKPPVCGNCKCPVSEHIPVRYNGGPWENAVCRNCLCEDYVEVPEKTPPVWWSANPLGDKVILSLSKDEKHEKFSEFELSPEQAAFMAQNLINAANAAREMEKQ